MHTFNFDQNGNLQHFIGGELRAVIAPEHIAGYKEFFPDAPEPAIEGEATVVEEKGILSKLGLLPSGNPLAGG